MTPTRLSRNAFSRDSDLPSWNLYLRRVSFLVGNVDTPEDCLGHGKARLAATPQGCVAEE